LGRGFEQTGQGEVWRRLLLEVKANGMDGVILQKNLRKLGWKIIYWNPDPSNNKKWDAEDIALNPLQEGRVWMPVWGGHAIRYSEVIKRKTYYKVPVDDVTLLVDFKNQQPRAFKEIDFFVGTAHSGYHVFPGMYGDVIEGHSMRAINSISNLETSVFNPLAPRGGPRWTSTEKYRSGLIAVPPHAKLN
jgi:hypothetical protein